jgi:5-methylcytosine-specific restriction endonuclease McrA
MMTSDHKIPKSLGGKDHISNRQPMCQPHNFEKGNRLIYI